MREVLVWVLFAIALVMLVYLGAWLDHQQKYIQDSNTTATKGLFFTNTLKLKEYKLVASGKGLWGKYDRYTRSDRHTDVLTIYCTSYCK